MQRRSPIFIGGTGRCGTTVLTRILARHPNIFALRWESQFLVAPDGLLNLLASGCSREEADAFIRMMRGRWFYRVLNSGKPNEYVGGLCFDLSLSEVEKANLYLRRTVNRSPKSRNDLQVAARYVERLLEPTTRRQGALRWCEKTPRSILFVEKLARAFASLKFIHIIRDGRDVVASMMEKGFWPIASGPDFPQLAHYRGRVTFDLATRYWVDVLKLARSQAQAVPSQMYIEIKFEDLIQSPQSVLESICAFLGEDFDESMLEQDLSKPNIGRWKHGFSPRQARLFEEIAGETMREGGYL